jgi:hypothetical protein
MASRPRLALAGAIALAISLIPFGGYLGLPLLLLATWVHEAGHAAATLLTGGGVERLEVFSDGSGRVTSSGIGSTTQAVVIASAGYVTTSIVAGLLLVAGRFRGAVRPALLVVGGGMLLSAALIPGEGRVSVALIGLALVGAAFTPIAVRALVLDVVALVTGLNAIRALWVLFGPQGAVDGEPAGDDADAVAELWFGPSAIWAVLWFAIAVAALAGALVLRLRAARSPETAPAPAIR